MRAGTAGRLLLAAGGLLVVLGVLFPEARVLAWNAFHPGSRRPAPDRSHWFVLRDNLEMLANPDPFASPEDEEYARFYVVEAAGLAFPAAAGLALALSALASRRRLAAAAFATFHAAAYGALAFLAWRYLEAASDEADAGGLRRGLTWGCVGLTALCAAEGVIAAFALRRGSRARFAPVDAVGLLPAAFLLLLDAALFVALRRQPNWPSAGYLVSAVGALVALGGIWLRRGAVARETAAPSGERLS